MTAPDIPDEAALARWEESVRRAQSADMAGAEQEKILVLIEALRASREECGALRSKARIAVAEAAGLEHVAGELERERDALREERARLRAGASAAVHEAHMLGRIYSRMGEPEKPGDVWKALEAMLAKKLEAPDA